MCEGNAQNGHCGNAPFISSPPPTDSTLVGLALLIVEVSKSHSDTHTLGRTPRDERSDRRRELHLTKHNSHDRQTPMTPAGFGPIIQANERPQTHALDTTAIYMYNEKQKGNAYRQTVAQFQ